MPIDLYIDQMVFSTAARTAGWRTEHYLGALVEPLVRAGRVRVRPSLAHHSETLLYVHADEDHDCELIDTERLDERKRIAEVIWELSDFDHPVLRWEVFALREFLDVLGRIVPAVVMRGGIDELVRLDREGLRGKMHALATHRDEHSPAFYRHAWAAKLSTQLAQARLRDRGYMDRLLAAVDRGEKAPSSEYDDLESKPLPELRRLVAEEVAKLSAYDTKRARGTWQANRRKLEKAYTLDSLICTLDFLLSSTEPLPAVMNIHEIAAAWPSFEAQAGKMNLPAPLPDLNAAARAGMPKPVIIGRLLQPLVERLLGAADLPTTRTAMYVASLQIDDALSDQGVGTGNVFDCERAIALHEVDIFHTNDARLARHARQAAKQFGLERVTICEGERQLRDAVDRVGDGSGGR